jgi:hypothetical protein
LAQEKVTKISQELSNKDRVMKSQLEEKDREIKRLKSLGDKAAAAAADKGQGQGQGRLQGQSSRESLLGQRRGVMGKGFHSRSSLASSGVSGGQGQGQGEQQGQGQGQGQLSAEQMTQLQGWLTREIDDQAWRVTLTEEIKSQNEERALVNKRLAHLKHLRDTGANGRDTSGVVISSSALVTVASRSEEEIQREVEIKHLEV